MINVENFTKLAKYLRSLPDDYVRFDMGTFHMGYGSDSDDNPLDEDEIPCGTVACALGHGPAAGVTTTSDDWLGYYLANFSGESYAYLWCFDNDWIEIDNTHQGAALRIELMLKMHPEFNINELTEQYKDITGVEFERYKDIIGLEFEQ